MSFFIKFTKFQETLIPQQAMRLMHCNKLRFGIIAFPMSVTNLFATPIYHAPICDSKRWAPFAKSLLGDCYKIENADSEGLEWSEFQYPGGYTSYSSISDLLERSSDLIKLREMLDKHVRDFVKKLEYDLDPKELKINTSWLNINRRGGHHAMHLHPQSVISGTVYLATPKNSGSLKFEDPRLSKFMAAPARKSGAKLINQTFVEVEPRAGHVILFESWLRHQVEPNFSDQDRISISFNYSHF